jgi:hypothetical protein
VLAITFVLPLLAAGYNPLADGPVFATTLAAFAAVFLLGRKFTAAPASAVLLGTLASSVVFHLLTNTAAWLGSPLYPNTLGGFWQSVWTGPAGSTLPSWVFLRNLAAANLLFTGVILLARHTFPAALPQGSATASR